MAKTLLVDTGFLVALLNRRDSLHLWAKTQAPSHAPPWLTCEAVLSEAFHLLGAPGAPGLSALLRRKALLPAFNIASDLDPVLKLMQKYADLPCKDDRPRRDHAVQRAVSISGAVAAFQAGCVRALCAAAEKLSRLIVWADAQCLRSHSRAPNTSSSVDTSKAM